MTSREFRQVLDFEDTLVIGSTVKANWTNSHQQFSTQAEVIKINAKSIVVVLTKEIRGYWLKANEVLYPSGKKIHLPRIGNFKLWSVNNRAEPEVGY